MSPTSKQPPRGDDVISAANLGNEIMLFRVSGLGNMRNALPLADFAEASFKKGIRRFAIDLADCQGMDSTFMGTLVGMAQAVRGLPQEGMVCLTNVSSANRELLEIVGADTFFVMDAKLPVTGSLEMVPLPNVQMSSERRLRLVHKAHENLAEINQYNERQFGAILKSMTAELDRKAAESGLFESLGEESGKDDAAKDSGKKNGGA